MGDMKSYVQSYRLIPDDITSTYCKYLTISDLRTD